MTAKPADNCVLSLRFKEHHLQTYIRCHGPVSYTHLDVYKRQMLGNFQNFENAMEHYMTRFLTPSLYCSMNELSNHDHSRFLTRTNQKAGRAASLGCEAASQEVDKAVLKEAVVFQMRCV